MLLKSFRHLALLTSSFSAFFAAHTSTAAELSGSILIDGSSTVGPISEAVAEEFQKAHPKVRVSVGTSGTGGGFKKFVAKEIAISDASRPMKPDEDEKAKANKIDYLALSIAIDGVSVVVHPQNKLSSISYAQLKEIWKPESTVKSWSDVDKTWPSAKLKLYGPGTDSGTFDYFTEEIVGKAKASRSDFSASENDNMLVSGVSQDVNALGYFGYEYYVANKKKLKVLAVDKGDGKGAIAPTANTIENGTYPLSRPLFIYVSHAAAQKAEVAAFVDFYLANAGRLAKDVGSVALPDARYKEETTKWIAWKSGAKAASSPTATVNKKTPAKKK